MSLIEKIKAKEAELLKLKEIQELNLETIETRGRKIKLDEPLVYKICFNITQTQKTKLEIVKERGINLSVYIRQALFGGDF